MYNITLRTLLTGFRTSEFFVKIYIVSLVFYFNFFSYITFLIMSKLKTKKYSKLHIKIIYLDTFNLTVKTIITSGEC